MNQKTYPLRQFYKRPIWQNYVFIFVVWMLAMIVCAATKTIGDAYNNFSIFRGVFHHTVNCTPLFETYPVEYFDINHYGVVFSFLIAPFAVIPVWLALPLWLMANATLLFVAIKALAMPRWKHAVVFWFAINELYTAACMQQFNIAIAAFIILTFVMVEKNHTLWAAFFIALGLFTKLYGIVGVAFFFFSREKLRFILYLALWSVVMYVLPMIISSFDFVNRSYVDWFEELTQKNVQNYFSSHQNVSLLGLVRKATMSETYSDLWLIVPGMILMALPYLRVKQYVNTNFRLMSLAAVLLFMVLFSTGSESSGYISAVVAVGIWFVVTPTYDKHKWLNVSLFVFVVLLTQLSATDIFPSSVRQAYVFRYGLKALPCALVWMKVIYELLVCDFACRQESVNLKLNKTNGK